MAISLTHVQYPQGEPILTADLTDTPLPHTGDLLGMVLAWFSLLPIFILIGFTTLILFRRDLHTVSPG